MKLAKGPRPWSIWAFTASILSLALFKLGFSLVDLPLTKIKYEEQYSWFEWNQDWAIVASFSEFTIALIPLVWITVFGARFARWFILFFGVWTMLWALISLWGGFFFGDRILLRSIEPLLIAATIVFLFLPESSRWLAKLKVPDADSSS